MKIALNITVALLLLCLSLHLQAADLSSAYKAMRLGDFNGAAEIFTSAAADGSVEAQYQLGKLYLVGRGVAKDEALARKWLEEAARQNEPNAQYTLALLLLASGETEEARNWLQQATALGNRRAQSELEKLTTTNAPVSQDSLSGDIAQQWRRAALACDTKSLQQLLEKGAPVNARDDHNRGALYYLVACHSTDAIRLLLDHGVDVNNIDHYGESPLTMAVKQGDSATIKLLLAAGADTRVTTRSGDSLLHLAVLSHSVSALEVLLEKGVPSAALNTDGYTPLDLAMLLQDKAAAQTLSRVGATHGARWQASQGNTGGSIADYLATKDKADTQDIWQLARQAAVQDQAEVLGELLERHGSGAHHTAGCAGPNPVDVYGRSNQHGCHAGSGGSGREPGSIQQG